MTTAERAEPPAGPQPADTHVLRRPSPAGDAARVVLLHGITDSAACWGSVAAELDPRYEVVMPDARGHGATPLPDEPITVDVLAADVERLLEAEGPAVIVGHSMGAATATVVAARRPDLVRGVVLEDPPWHEAEEVRAIDRADGPSPLVGDDPEPDAFDFPTWVRELQALDHAGRVAAGRAGDPDWSEAELEPWAAAKAQLDLQFFDRMESGTLRSTWELVPELTVPTLLVIGDVERGAFVSQEAGRTAAERAADLTVLHLEGTSHSIHRDQPGRYVPAVNGFLDRMLA